MFFDDLIGKLEMACAKVDPRVARLYVERLGGSLSVMDELEAELDRTVRALLAVREQDRLLADQPVLQTELVLREPYLDPLSILQIALLERRQSREPDPDTEERHMLDLALGSTLNGLAQGLRNVG